MQIIETRWGIGYGPVVADSLLAGGVGGDYGGVGDDGDGDDDGGAGSGGAACNNGTQHEELKALTNLASV